MAYVTITRFRDTTGVDAWGNPTTTSTAIAFEIRTDDFQPYKGDSFDLTEDGTYKHRLRRMFIFDDSLDIVIGDRILHQSGEYTVIEIGEYTGHHKEIILRGEGE